MSRSGALTAALGVGAIACAVGAGVWLATAERSAFYEGAGVTRADAGTHEARDVLWRAPERLGEPVASGRDEYEPSVSLPAGGQREELYFVRRSAEGDADLYVSRRVGRGWSAPEALAGVNSVDNEQSPRVSPDGAWLYFASDRAGGEGGLDLWRAPRAGSSWGEAEPAPGVNTPANETTPAFSPDLESMWFASDREVATAEGEPARGRVFDLYRAPYGAGADGSGAVRVDQLSSDGNDVSPTVSPVGDFVYFASDREGGAGGLDLYRARALPSDDGLRFGVVRSLGAPVNTAANELDPAAAMEGFELVYSSDGPLGDEGEAGDYDLLRTVSREVELARATEYGELAALLRLLPWILAALALVLLLAMLRRLAEGGAKSSIGALSLMARCVLASLLLHAALLALLALWVVEPEAGELGGDGGGTRVALTSSSVRESIRSQVRASSGAAVEVGAAAAADAVRDSSFEAAAGSGSSPEARASAVRVGASSLETAAPVAPRAGGREPAFRAAAGEERVRIEAAVPEAGAARSGAEPRLEGSMPAAREAGRAAARDAWRAARAEAAPGVRAARVRAVGGGARRTDSAAPAPRGVRVEAAAPSRGGSPAVTLSAPKGRGAAEAAEPEVRVFAASPGRSARADAPAEAVEAVERGPSAPSSRVRAGGAALERVEPAPGAPASRVAAPEIAAARADRPALRAPAAHGKKIEERGGQDEVDPELAWAAPGRATVSARAEAASPEAGGPRVERASRRGVASGAARVAPPAPGSGLAAAPEAGSRRGSLGALRAPAVREIAPEPDTLSGRVIDAVTGEGIGRARVRLDRVEQVDASARTDAGGAFILRATDIPDNAAVSASAPGYTPYSTNLTSRALERGASVKILLWPEERLMVALEPDPEVHHLGNDAFTGRVNSQFQRRSEGLVITLPFKLGADQAPPAIGRATLHLLVKGAQLENRVYLNGRRVRGSLPESPADGSFGPARFELPALLLREGENELRIQSVRRGDTDYDDFEFVNPRVELLPSDAVVD